MKKIEYLIIDKFYGDPVCLSNSKKEIKKDLKSWIDWKRYTWYNDFRIFKYEYDPKKVYSYLDFYDFFFYDKENDNQIEYYEEFEKYWIKQKEIKKDFLYHNNRK